MPDWVLHWPNSKPPLPGETADRYARDTAAANNMSRVGAGLGVAGSGLMALRASKVKSRLNSGKLTRAGLERAGFRKVMGNSGLAGLALGGASIATGLMASGQRMARDLRVSD